MGRAAGFLAVRALGSRSASPGLYLCAWLYGSLCALVPTGVQDAMGAGILGGLQAGLVGMFATCPILVPFVLAGQIGTDIEGGVARDFSLSAISAKTILAGGVLAAWRELALLFSVAVVGATLTGLGDGLRHHNVLGQSSIGVTDVLVGVILIAYLSVLSTALLVMGRSSIVLVVVAALLVAMLLGSSPLVDRFGLSWLNSVNPIGLFGTYVPDIAGRFRPHINVGIWCASAAGWLGLSIVAISLRARHVTLEQSGAGTRFLTDRELET